MATRDGLAQIWYADANGVVTGYTPTADNVASAIIDTYNEHYGTDINIWTPETKNLQVGDTVPNWSAYEKIEMPIQSIKSLMPGGTDLYAFGHIQDKKFLLASATEDRFYVVKNSTGVVESMFNRAEEFAETIIKPKLLEAGLDIEETGLETFSYEVGDEIPNWNSYKEI